MLPSDHAKRKSFPLLTFLTAYFPDMIEALVELSVQGNLQHNIDPNAQNPFKLPTDRITWDRSKSMDQCETIMRHLWDHMRALRGAGDVRDSDGILHITKAMWRCGAEGQLTIERLRELDAEMSRAVETADAARAAVVASLSINGGSLSDPVPELLPENQPASGPRRGYNPPPPINPRSVGLHRDIPGGLDFDPAD